MGWRRHHDADIYDKDSIRGWLLGNNRWFDLSNSDSSESPSSEESSSEEEVEVTEQPPLIMTTAVVPVVSTEEGSTLTPEQETPSTNVTNVMETTTQPPMVTVTLPVNVTLPCDGCVTVEIITAVPITDKRGDN